MPSENMALTCQQPRKDEGSFTLTPNAHQCRPRWSQCGQLLQRNRSPTPAGFSSRSGTDGRTLCFVRDGKVHLVSRRKNSLNERFPELREIGKVIKAKAALIDGEVVAVGEDGLPQFDALRFRRGRKCSIVFYAFDLLHLDGFEMRSGIR